MTKKSVFICILILLLGALAFADIVDSIGDVVLKPSMEDADVSYLKLSMMILGYYDTQTLTQNYDAVAVEAVKAYQKASALDVDGIVGQQTYDQLYADDALPTIKSKVLKPSESNLEVKKLKVALRSLNYFQSPVVDDIYDAATVEALKAFQKAENLDVDGIAGQATFNRLIELKRLLLSPIEEDVEVINASKLEKGMVDEEVIILQKALAAEGLFTATEYSTRFGDLTLKAVVAFQQKYKLTTDGVAGTGTLTQLEALGYIKRGTGIAVNPVVTRGTRSGKFGEYIAWKDVQPLFVNGKTVLTIEDFETGTTFKVQVSFGHLHADVEALTADDAKIIKSLWGGDWSWNRRAVLVYYKDRILAASMNGMPHAGLDAYAVGQTVSGRSGGFGKGYNYDAVKSNLMDGHICLHFKDSKLHNSNSPDAKHQAMIKKAAGVN